MHVVPRDMHHRRRRVEELEDRAPALIDLPFSLPSIPILGPILTPLIGGPSPKTTTPSTPPSTPQPTATPTTTTTPAAPPVQTPTAPTTQPSNPQSPTTSPNGSPATGGGNGNGSTSSNNDSTPEPSGSSPSSPSESNPPGLTLPSGSSPSNDTSNSVLGTPSRSGDPAITISGDGQAFLTSPTQETGGNTSPNGATQASIPAYLGSVTLTGSPTGATTGSTSVNDDPGNSAQAGTTHHGLSSGALAAIVIVSALLGFALLFCCMRRRAIAARVRRRREWFAGGTTQDMGYADATASPASARSSFATNYDQGQGQDASGLPASNFSTLQTAQTMQQIWPSDLSGSIVAVPPASHAVESSPSPTIRVTPDRSSTHSASSGSPSRPSSQVSLPYLIVPSPAAEASDLSPISVRPFSPTETWSFPQPPKDDESVRLASQIRRSSTTISSQSNASFPAENPQNPPKVAENPFAEPATEDPFADPASAAWPESPTVPCFPAIETVRRPFVPSMPDEMAVDVGDQIRVIHGFDDGWATVQNVATGAQGLVPLDRMVDDKKEVPAPAFLAKKRVSSYVRPRDSTLTRASVVSVTSTVGAAL